MQIKKLLLSLALFSNLSLVCSYADDNQAFSNIYDSPSVNQPTIWERMRNGFMLDHKETKEVAYWEKKYSNPKYFNIMMTNAAPYLYYELNETERNGIPSELALIPIVETTYNINAISPKGISTGMWQFLVPSGKRFGLIINSDIDERRSVIKASQAALLYFEYLYDLFGSWEMAIAAYNWGEGNMYNAKLRAGSDDFYDLDVRDITRQYVPKIIALSNIIDNPSKFGITLPAIPNKPYFQAIQPQSSTTFKNFVSSNNISDDTVKKLNSQFRNPNMQIDNKTYILVPVDSINKTIKPTLSVPTSVVTSAPVLQPAPSSTIINDNDLLPSAPISNTKPTQKQNIDDLLVAPVTTNPPASKKIPPAPTAESSLDNLIEQLSNKN